MKTEHDLDRLRVTNEIAKLGLDAFKEHAAAGRTEAEVAADVQAAIVARGHGFEGTRTVRAYASVWSGPETAVGWQYFLHRDRRIERLRTVYMETLLWWHSSSEAGPPMTLGRAGEQLTRLISLLDLEPGSVAPLVDLPTPRKWGAPAALPPPSRTPRAPREASG